MTGAMSQGQSAAQGPLPPALPAPLPPVPPGTIFATPLVIYSLCVSWTPSPHSSQALTWALHLLVAHPEVMKRVRDEVSMLRAVCCVPLCADCGGVWRLPAGLPSGGGDRCAEGCGLASTATPATHTCA